MIRKTSACILVGLWALAHMVACEPRAQSDTSACFDRSPHETVAQSFQTPIDTALAWEVWRIMVELEGRDTAWGPRARGEVDREVAGELARLTDSWRHVLLRLATRRVALPRLHPMLGPVGTAGGLLLSDPAGIVTADSGLALLAYEIAVRGQIADSAIGALYVLTEGALFGVDTKLPQELVGARALLCVLTQQAYRGEWSDTVSAFVAHLVPSVLLILETNDQNWQRVPSDSAIAHWPDRAGRAAASVRLAELRKLQALWWSDQSRP
jgi:hypothetical protein